VEMTSRGGGKTLLEEVDMVDRVLGCGKRENERERVM